MGLLDFLFGKKKEEEETIEFETVESDRQNQEKRFEEDDTEDEK